MLKTLNTENFNKEIENGLKLVEFHTSWCGYCKKQQPELEAMEKVWIGQIDADNSPEIAAKYNINSFPTFLIMKNGSEVERINGMRKKEDLMHKIMKYLN